MSYTWVMDNNCVKHPDPTWQQGIMTKTQIWVLFALLPWPWRYDLWSRSWSTLGWNIIKILRGSKEWWSGHGFWICVNYDFDFGDTTFGSRSWHIPSLTSLIWNIIQINSKELWTSNGFCLCDLDLGDMSRSWHTIGLWTTIVGNIIQIKHDSKELCPRHEFCYECTVAMTVGQGQDTPMGHGQQWCEILPRWDKG